MSKKQSENTLNNKRVATIIGVIAILLLSSTVLDLYKWNTADDVDIINQLYIKDGEIRSTRLILPQARIVKEPEVDVVNDIAKIGPMEISNNFRDTSMDVWVVYEVRPFRREHTLRTVHETSPVKANPGEVVTIQPFSYTLKEATLFRVTVNYGTYFGPGVAASNYQDVWEKVIDTEDGIWGDHSTGWGGITAPPAPDELAKMGLSYCDDGVPVDLVMTMSKNEFGWDDDIKGHFTITAENNAQIKLPMTMRLRGCGTDTELTTFSPYIRGLMWNLGFQTGKVDTRERQEFEFSRPHDCRGEFYIWAMTGCETIGGEKYSSAITLVEVRVAEPRGEWYDEEWFEWIANTFFGMTGEQLYLDLMHKGLHGAAALKIISFVVAALLVIILLKGVIKI